MSQLGRDLGLAKIGKPFFETSSFLLRQVRESSIRKLAFTYKNKIYRVKMHFRFHRQFVRIQVYEIERDDGYSNEEKSN